MPVKKKKAAAKKPVAKAKKAAPAKAVTAKKSIVKVKKSLVDPQPFTRTHIVYVESAAFFPPSSSAGYIDLFQDGRCAAVAGQSLSTAIPIPVGAALASISIHYMNTTANTVNAIFLRKHADRHSPSGEIEMSFISLPPGTLPPDNYLTVTDTSFPDSGIIQDRFLHYIEIPGTGDFGRGGKLTVRGISYAYVF